MKLMKIEIDGNALFNKLIWLLIAGAITFAAKKASDMDTKFGEMSKEISQLNLTMVGIAKDQAYTKDSVKDHEGRIRKLEGNKTHAPLEN